jgi:hypothetical protein
MSLDARDLIECIRGMDREQWAELASLLQPRGFVSSVSSSPSDPDDPEVVEYHQGPGGQWQAIRMPRSVAEARKQGCLCAAAASPRPCPTTSLRLARV